MFTPNHVSVTVISARNLTGKGKNGKNDAFVVIQLDDKKFQTSVQKKATSPYWEEECEFSYENKYSELLLTVYHRNLLGFDEFLGQLRLPLDEVYEPPKALNPNHPPPSRWFPLKGKSGKKEEHKYRGELEIRLVFARKQQQQQVPPTGALQINNVTIHRRDSFNATKPSAGQQNALSSRPPSLEGGGLQKSVFKGSMPSLVSDSRRSSPPPSPTSSVSSRKKKSFLSKLKQSASFSARQNHQIVEPNSGTASVRSSIAFGPPSALEEEGEEEEAFYNHRQSALGPLSEHQQQQPPATGGGSESAVSPEPDDPGQQVVKVQKRGGGIMSFGGGGGRKKRPASAVITNDRIAVLPTNRFTLSFGDGSRELIGVPPSRSLSNVQSDDALNSLTSAEELRAIVNEQRSEIISQRAKIRELEEYIDRLLLRVITTQPELLQNVSWEEPVGRRAHR